MKGGRNPNPVSDTDSFNDLGHKLPYSSCKMMVIFIYLYDRAIMIINYLIVVKHCEDKKDYKSAKKQQNFPYSL